MTKVIDFDAFRAEQNAEPLILKIGGHEYELPASIPATLALDIIRRNPDESNVEIEANELATMGDKVFGGREAFNRILDENGITMAELPDLFKMVFAMYNGASDDPNPETPDPKSAETASSI